MPCRIVHFCVKTHLPVKVKLKAKPRLTSVFVFRFAIFAFFGHCVFWMCAAYGLAPGSSCTKHLTWRFSFKSKLWLLLKKQRLHKTSWCLLLEVSSCSWSYTSGTALSLLNPCTEDPSNQSKEKNKRYFWLHLSCNMTDEFMAINEENEGIPRRVFSNWETGELETCPLRVKTVTADVK